MRTRSQRLLSMVLALSMLLTFLPLSAFADDTPPSYAASNADPQPLDPDDNTYTADGNTYTYELNTADHTATLTKFTGTTADVPETVEKDDISYTVTAIGASAFINHGISSPLTSVNLPDSIQTIGDGAFQGCSSLTNITLREGLTTVGHAAFALTKLTDVTIPKSLKEVGVTAFASSPDPIKTITYHGTETAWNTLLSSNAIEGGTVAESNPQLTSATNYYYAHTVTFNVGEHGTAPDPQVVQYDEKATKPNSDPTADGYKFMGWFTTPNGNEAFDFDTTKITKDETVYAHWEEEEKKPAPTPEQPGTPEKPNEPTPPEVPAVEEDDTAAIGYAAAAVTAAFVGWGAYRIGSEVYLKYLLPKDVLLPQNRIQLAELLWEDAGRPAPADAAAYADVDDTDAQQAARWAVENGLLTLPDTEKPEEFAPYRSVSYAKSARAWNKAQQLKENAAAR